MSNQEGRSTVAPPKGAGGGRTGERRLVALGFQASPALSGARVLSMLLSSQPLPEQLWVGLGVSATQVHSLPISY